MLEWISENLFTLIISVLLAAVVFFILRKLVRDRKRGKSSCGCGCESCPMSGSCHKAK